MSGANYLQFVAGKSSFCPERSPEKSKARLLKPTEKNGANRRRTADG